MTVCCAQPCTPALVAGRALSCRRYQSQLQSKTGMLAAILVLLLLACVALPTSVQAVGVVVGAGETFDVSELVAPETIVTFQFHTPQEGYPIDVVLRDERGNELFVWRNEKEGVHEVEATGTKPKMIYATFDNQAAMMTSKPVSFYFRSRVNYNIAATTEGLDPIEQKISVLSATMQHLQTLQARLRGQQKEHRKTVENANTRVKWWAVFQVVALIVMSAFQLFFLRRFLEKKRFL